MKLGNFYNFNQSTDFNTANSDYFAQILSEMHRTSNKKKISSYFGGVMLFICTKIEARLID